MESAHSPLCMAWTNAPTGLAQVFILSGDTGISKRVRGLCPPFSGIIGITGQILLISINEKLVVNRRPSVILLPIYGQCELFPFRIQHWNLYHCLVPPFPYQFQVQVWLDLLGELNANDLLHQVMVKVFLKPLRLSVEATVIDSSHRN